MKQYDLVASNAIEEFEGGDFVYADEALAEIERLNALIAELNAAWDVDKEMLEKYRNAKIVGWASPMFSILMPVTKTTVFGSHTIAVYSHEEIE